ncbi:MAG: hypothetical protein ACYTFY_00655 [Planctomycetota bacterium]|jgi:hypothetical protein
MSEIILPGSSEDLKVNRIPDFMLSLNSANNLTSVDKLSVVARSGFHLAELGAGPGELADPAKLAGMGMSNTRKALRENEVNVSAIRSDIALGSYSLNQKNDLRDSLRKLIDISETIGASVFSVTAGSVTESNEAEKYALDLIYSLESQLNESRVKLALSCAGDSSSFICNPESLNTFTREAPDCVGLSISDSDLEIPYIRDNISMLAENSDISTIRGRESDSGSCALQSRADAEFLLKGLSKNSFNGNVIVNPAISNIDCISLSEFYKIALDFIPECFI